MARKSLLACGLAASLLYVAMNVFVPRQWEAYSSFSQTISELSAVDAPTRSLWVPLGIVYTLLVAAFGVGVWKAAHRDGQLRVLGALFVANGIIGLAWPPMHCGVVRVRHRNSVAPSRCLAHRYAALSSLPPVKLRTCQPMTRP